MLFASIALAALAVLLAWPVPLLLSSASWPGRAPATALILWQAIALAGGLAMIGALLTFGLLPFGDDLVDGSAGLVEATRTGEAGDVRLLPHVLALCGAVLLGGHLILNLLLTAGRTERDRRHHRRLVELLSTRDPDRPGGRILDSAVPFAYCLPAAAAPLTVYSEGLLELLSEEEVRAVIAHEQGHLSQRHDLVLVAFRAWNVSLPWFPVASRAERAVGTLVEMLADDQARRSVADATLARAIAVLGGAAIHVTSTASDLRPGRLGPDWDRAIPDSLARVQRLTTPRPPLSASASSATVFAAVGLLAIPTLVLLVPAVSRLAG